MLHVDSHLQRRRRKRGPMTEQKRKRGRPPGSVKRPKSERQLDAVESKIVDHMDAIVSVMVDHAMKGDVKIGQYLINRVLGKPTEKSEITQKGEQTIKVEYVEDWRNQ